MVRWQSWAGCLFGQGLRRRGDAEATTGIHLPITGCLAANLPARPAMESKGASIESSCWIRLLPQPSAQHAFQRGAASFGADAAFEPRTNSSRAQNAATSPFLRLMNNDQRTTR